MKIAYRDSSTNNKKNTILNEISKPSYENKSITNQQTNQSISWTFGIREQTNC